MINKVRQWGIGWSHSLPRGRTRPRSPRHQGHGEEVELFVLLCQSNKEKESRTDYHSSYGRKRSCTFKTGDESETNTKKTHGVQFKVAS